MTALITVPGPIEASVRAKYDPDRELYAGIPIGDWDKAMDEMEELRRRFLPKLIECVGGRVPCIGLLYDARITMFDFTGIPLGKTPVEVARRADYGNDAIKTFVSQFHKLWMDDRGVEALTAAVTS